MGISNAVPQSLRQFYQSSPMREGVLCWYPFRRDASVLDLSGGVLGELLKRRCSRVVAGSMADVACELFDYAVVLDPVDFSVDALAALKDRLNPHGRLLLAYENPFALRYWSGKASPYTGLSFDPLFGRDNRVSSPELRVRLNLVGFGGQKWYYPLADHWFTHELYSECYLPDEYLNQRYIPYIADDPMILYDERPLYREVIRGGAFGFMCGAYLVEARVNALDEACTVDYAAVTAYRDPAKRFATTVHSNGTVRKTPLHPDGKTSIANTLRNHDDLTQMGINVIPLQHDGESIIMPRIKLPTLWDYWVRKLTDGTFDEEEMFGQFDRIRDDIMIASKTGKCYWELVPANCFYDAGKDELTYFDQESCWDGFSSDVAVARALWALKYSPAFNADARTPGWLELLKARYGLAERWEELSALADVRTLMDVFGSGMHILEAESEIATKRAAMRASENNAKNTAENNASNQRYKRFCPVIQTLNNLGINNVAIYGLGLRGLSLRDVLADHGIRVAALLDRKIFSFKPMDVLLKETSAEMLIVSILDGKNIAEDLRGKLHIPIYTLEELL